MSKITHEINKISMAVIGISGRLVFYGLVLVLLFLGARTGYDFGYRIFYAPAMEAEPGRSVEITLKGNESVFEVGDILVDAGLVRDDVAFGIQALCYGYEVKAGTWNLSTSKPSKELINTLNEEPRKEEDA